MQRGNLTYYVNGQLVNQTLEGALTEGRLLFQSEGAEGYGLPLDTQVFVRHCYRRSSKDTGL